MARNLIASFAGKVWVAVMGLAFVPIYIRLMGIEAYGLIGFFATLQAITTLLDLGISTTVNRELAQATAHAEAHREPRHVLRTFELVYWAIALSLGLAVVALAPFIAERWIQADQLSGSTVQAAVTLMGLVLAFQWPYNLYAGGLMGLERQVLLNVTLICLATLRGVGAVLVLWLVSPTVPAFFLWQLAVSVCQTLVVGLLLWRSLPARNGRARFQTAILRSLWRFAAGLSGIAIVTVLLTQLDKVLLSRMLSLEAFGYYSLAGVVASGLYYLIGPIYSVMFPKFSQLVALHDDSTLTRLYHRGSQLLSVVVFPVAVTIALFSREIILLWTGNSIAAEQTYLIASLLIIGTALNGIMNIPYALQLAYGWTKLALYLNIVSALLLIPLLIWATTHYGGVGAAATWVVLNAGYVVVGIQLMHRRLLQHEKMHWYLQDVGKPLLAVLLPALLIRWGTAQDASPAVMGTAVVAVLCLTSASAVWFTPFARERLLNAASRLLRREHAYER